MRANRVIIFYIIILTLVLSSCVNHPSVSKKENSTTSIAQSITTEVSEESVIEIIYQKKTYPEYGDVVEYNLTDLNIENANLYYVNYIGNDIIAVFCQENDSNITSYYKFFNYKTGEVLFKKNSTPVPYNNGFAFISSGNEGLNGRINLDVYNYDGEYRENVEPDAFWLFSINGVNQYFDFKEIPLSEKFTIRKTGWRLYLRDEELNTNEVIFENTLTEQYIFKYPVNETQFLFFKLSKNSKSQYGIYDVISKEIIYYDTNIFFNTLDFYAVLDNKIFSFNKKFSMYATNIEGKVFGEPKELFRLPKDSYICATKISPDNRSILIISYQLATENNYSLEESFKIDILDAHTLDIVLTKSIKLNKNIDTMDLKTNLVYLNDGTIAFTARELTAGRVKDTFLYVLNVK